MSLDSIFLLPFLCNWNRGSWPICHGACKAVKAARLPPAEKPTKRTREGLSWNELISSTLVATMKTNKKVNRTFSYGPSMDPLWTLYVYS